MKFDHYFHGVTRARVKVIVDCDRGYDTLNIELFDADGAISRVAIFFPGKAEIDGAKVDEVDGAGFRALS